MSRWLNTKHIRWKRTFKPCHALHYCPYGQLVEEFPLPKKRTKLSCKVFGHDCPVFYHAEPMMEDKPAPTTKEVEATFKEFKKFFNQAKPKPKPKV